MTGSQPTLAGVARFCGRGLLIAGFVYVVSQVVQAMPLVFVSLFTTLLVTSLLMPVADRLGRFLPRTVAALASLLLAVGVVGGLLAFIIPRTVARISANSDTLARRLENLARSLAGLLPGPRTTLNDLGVEAEGWVRRHAQELALGAASGLSSIAGVLTGLFLVLALVFFFVKDGRGMVSAALAPLSPERRRMTRAALEGAWRTLSGWVRGTVLVALIDAVGIGVGLLLVRVPLALPLALLTFLGAFVPIIGALVAGVVAVVVAWALVGMKAAIIVLAIVLAVQQLEGNVLQPFIMGRVLPLHPAVVL
ncbi:AI-2E family transporter, partial [Corallococcus sp. 4LFB]|uniref:AI-2E family transporter n=1 Tax=Corallococcus sp. 4LFB TaxID=3383249 RepID=UPI003975BE47